VKRKSHFFSVVCCLLILLQDLKTFDRAIVCKSHRQFDTYLLQITLGRRLRHYSDHPPSQHRTELQLANRPNVLGSVLPVSCHDSRSSDTRLALFILASWSPDDQPDHLLAGIPHQSFAVLDL
jgi:hypothetical protein